MINGSFTGVSLRKIVKGAWIGFTGFTGSLIGMALDFLSGMVIGRWLGASKYGLVNLGLVVVPIAVTFSMLGLHGGINRYVSFYLGREDHQRIKDIILDAMTINFPNKDFFTPLIFLNVE